MTYQTFFGRYAKLSGMTGTARSEKEEFSKTYGRDVQVIPTHEPMIRTDFEDEVMGVREEQVVSMPKITSTIARPDRFFQPRCPASAAT